MVIVSPVSRVMGPLPNGLSMAYKWGVIHGDPNYLRSSWDDPPFVGPHGSMVYLYRSIRLGLICYGKLKRGPN